MITDGGAEKPMRLVTTEIKDGLLVITCGVEYLAHLVHSSDGLDMNVTDNDRFAEDVLKELRVDSEDGSTLVHRAIDAAIIAAIESGSEWVEEFNEDDAGDEPDAALAEDARNQGAG